MKRLILLLAILFSGMTLSAQSCISVKDALAIYSQVIPCRVKQYTSYIKFRSPQTVAKIIAKYGYKSMRNYEEYRVDFYPYYYYKNCTRPSLYKESKPLGKGIPSCIGFGCEDTMTIYVFSRNIYNNMLAQFEQLGFQNTSYNSFTSYSNGKFDVSCSEYDGRYTIKVEKQY
jgi:hypothetical protein